jgi:hypothetical protein
MLTCLTRAEPGSHLTGALCPRIPPSPMMTRCAVANFGNGFDEPLLDNRSNLLNLCEKYEARAVRASAAHGPANMAITRLSVSYAGSESHAFFFAYRSRLMPSPSL